MTDRPSTGDICLYWSFDLAFQDVNEERWTESPYAAIAYLCRRLDAAEENAETYKNALAKHGYWPICLDCLRPLDWDVHGRCEAGAKRGDQSNA